MKISDKQLMQLINIAHAYCRHLLLDAMNGQHIAFKIDEILFEIAEQQSEELKVIE